MRHAHGTLQTPHDTFNLQGVAGQNFLQGTSGGLSQNILGSKVKASHSFSGVASSMSAEQDYGWPRRLIAFPNLAQGADGEGTQV